ncbi:MAG: hypothetical protein ACOYS2_02855 [Patescibacteria group bacterium]
MRQVGKQFKQRGTEIIRIASEKNTNSLLIAKYNEKPVLFNPGLGRISKSATAGLFLSQLLYWHKKGWNKEWVYKTIKEIKGETCLTRSEQSRAIKIWGELGVLEVKLRSIPRRRFFKINLEKLNELLKAEHKIRRAESNI